MPFEVPAAKASIKQNLFEFTVPGSRKVWSMPKVQYISASFSQRLASMGPTMKKVAQAQADGQAPDDEGIAAIAGMSELQREIFEHYCPGIYDILSNDQVGELATAWRKESSVGLGESSTSPES